MTASPGSDLNALHQELNSLRVRLAEREQQVEEAVRVSDEILRQLPAPVIITDVSGTILRWMGASERVLGYSPAAAVGQATGFLFPPESRDSILALLRQNIQNSGFYSGEVSCVRK